MNYHHVSTILGILALTIVYTFFRAASDVPQISPQGCRMSWMSPSYLLQSEFNTSWTPLANRYSLVLYREVGWEPNQAMGVPILFIPGNAGSSHQVRSIASSAARQYFSSPFVVSDEFKGRGAKPTDFYAVEFNEDLSAFHGPTLDSEIAYASAAVNFILSRYPPDTRVIVMGHSMGGVVGAALLPSENITALITMSTPHTLPPARFDVRIEEIYDRNQKVLQAAETPIVSICGGATDMMIPSESCILPGGTSVYRRTVFTSALEGAWTGVGHREMVWCHQVRWRIARAALELGNAPTAKERTRAVNRWLRDGSFLPPLDDGSSREMILEEGEYKLLSGGTRLALNRPLGRQTYLLPIPSTEDGVFILYVSQGSILGVSPHHASDLEVSVHRCVEHSTDAAAVVCDTLAPAMLKLLPAPTPGKPFPVPGDGTDESEGILFFEAEIPRGIEGWIGVTINAGDDGLGWVAGGFDRERNFKSDVGLWDLFFSAVKIPVPRPDDGGWKADISLPRLPATALLVYRLVPKMMGYPSCTAPFFSPLLVHTSQSASETHYHRLASDQAVFLHTHASSSYVPPLGPSLSYGLNLMMHIPGPSCEDVDHVHILVDWWASVGRLVTRYATALLSWSIGIVSLLLFDFWSLEGQQLSVDVSLGVFVRRRILPLMAILGAFSLLPLGGDYCLGVGEEIGLLRALLAVTLVGVATGMVCVSWWILIVLMWPLKFVRRGFIQRLESRKPEDIGMQRSRIISMALVLALIFLLVPWQVAFLGCWVTQVLNCNGTSRPKQYPGSAPTLASTPTSAMSDEQARDEGQAPKLMFANAHNQNTHMLLLMTWLLPLAAPVLVVWVRTLQTAGYTTPFNGDHNVFKVAPVLLLAELLGRGGPLRYGHLVRWGWLVVGMVAFIIGGRRAYVVYDVTCVQMVVLVVSQITFFG